MKTSITFAQLENLSIARPDLTAQCAWDGSAITYPDAIKTDVASAISALTGSEALTSLKSGFSSAVDDDAERCRLKFITGGTGQAMTYQAKAAEAKACLSDASPLAANYPLLSAEVGITAPDLPGVAAVVDAAYTQWLKLGAQIEAARLGGKKAIESSTDAESAKAAYERVTWPTGS